MATGIQQDIWQLRLAATLQAIQDIKEELSGEKAQSDGTGRDNSAKPPNLQKVPRFKLDERTRNIALLLVSNLEQFIEPHFNYFHTKYVYKEPIPPESSNESAMNSVLVQAAADLAAITQAIAQRATRVGSTSSPSSKRLVFADYLVEKSLEKVGYLFPIKRYLYDDGQVPQLAQLAQLAQLDEQPPIALTYFHKSPVIRVIPYANVALIGIPYTSLSTTVDLCAIPHELGHFVYWNAKIKHQYPEHDSKIYTPIYFALKNVLNNAKPGEILPEWLLKWREEIFADVFGASVAGYVMALDFQDLMLATDAFEAALDDGEHPSPIVRPNIYLNVLKALPFRNSANAIIELLGKRWDKRKKSVFGNVTTLKPNQLNNIAIDKSVEQLLAISTQKARELLIPDGAMPLAQIWTLPNEILKEIAHLNDPDQLDQLYAEWESQAPERPRPKPVPEQIPHVNWSALKAEWMREADEAKEFEPGEREWRSVRLAGGWIGGPGGPGPSTGG